MQMKCSCCGLFGLIQIMYMYLQQNHTVQYIACAKIHRISLLQKVNFYFHFHDWLVLTSDSHSLCKVYKTNFLDVLFIL